MTNLKLGCTAIYSINCFFFLSLLIDTEQSPVCHPSLNTWLNTASDARASNTLRVVETYKNKMSQPIWLFLSKILFV